MWQCHKRFWEDKGMEMHDAKRVEIIIEATMERRLAKAARKAMRRSAAAATALR